jgi:succinate--hydroxymethylglutarate CoA-transferase
MGGVHFVKTLLSQAAVMSTVASNWLNAGKEVQRVGTAHASVVPYQSFATADGYIMIACGTDRQVRVVFVTGATGTLAERSWTRCIKFGILASKLGHPEWATDPKYVTNGDRYANRDELVKLIHKTFTSQPTEHVRLFPRLSP